VTFKVDEQEYAILQPCDTGNEEGIIFKIVEEDGEEVLEYLTDDEEFERVAQEYEALMSEEE
jgi:cation transport regulator ChaC